MISITGRFTKNMFGSPRATTVPACHDRLRQRRKPGDWQSLISGHGHGGAAPSAHKQAIVCQTVMRYLIGNRPPIDDIAVLAMRRVDSRIGT